LQIKVAFLSGIIMSAPIWLYQLWAFIAPALHRRERRYSVGFIAAATPFFAMGAALGYLIIPTAVKVLLGFTPGSLSNLVNFDNYLEFVMRIILLFGLAFQLPVFLLTFNLIGFLSGRTILKPWRAWVFGICLFVASFSPSADPLSMLALAVPLICLYFIAGGLATLNDRRRSKKNSDLFTPDGRVSSAQSIEGPAPIDKDD
jgi:sec-independent protein translocase protein TatC